MVGTWLGEICSCSCLAVLPDSALVLLNKIYQPFFTSLYIFCLGKGWEGLQVPESLAPQACADVYTQLFQTLFTFYYLGYQYYSSHGFLTSFTS